jgi:hypothetical protein
MNDKLGELEGARSKKTRLFGSPGALAPLAKLFDMN